MISTVFIFGSIHLGFAITSVQMVGVPPVATVRGVLLSESGFNAEGQRWNLKFNGLFVF